jgi:DNA polymerase I
MEFELHPSVTLESGTFSVVTAPEELVLRGLNGTPALSRFLFLYVCGNYSRLLSGIRRRSAHFEVRRAFTLFQLLAILREAHHTILFLEHDPSLYEDEGSRSRGAPSRVQRGPSPPEQEEPLYASSSLDGPGSLQDPGYLLPEVAEALAEAARTALVVLYAPRPDPSLRVLARRADRVFCLEGGGGGGDRAGNAGRGGRGAARSGRPLPPGGAQTTLEVFGWAGPSRA